MDTVFMESLFKYKYYEIGYAELSEKKWRKSSC